jgi:putative aldouronate transport system substrate-binding protein
MKVSESSIRKRITAAVTAVFIIVLLTLQSGCSKQETHDHYLSAPFKEDRPILDVKYEPPVTITMGRFPNPKVRYKDGENIYDNVHTRWMREELGIELKTSWVVNSWDDITNKILLSANESLPDVLLIKDPLLLEDLIDSGKIMAIDEYFETWASSIVKQAYAVEPAAWHVTKRGDRNYAIPLLTSGVPGGKLMYIRNDWLARLGLKPPKTISELETVLDAFIHHDPDGNGKADTIGLAAGIKNSLTEEDTADLSPIFGAYGVIPTKWMLLSDGTVGYGSIQPEAKKALIKLREWVDKGYLKQNMALYDGNKGSEAFASGKAGVLFGPHYENLMAGTDLITNVPGATYDFYALPAGPTGKSGYSGEEDYNGMLVFNKNFKHMDAFMLYLNSLYEFWNPEGRLFRHGLAEGYDYVMVDGKPEYNVPGGKYDVKYYHLTNSRAYFPGKEAVIYKKLYEGGTAVTSIEKEFEAFGSMQIRAGHLANNVYRDTEIHSIFTGPPTTTMKAKWSDLEKMEREIFLKIIYGDLPIDEFDEFVHRWLSEGGEQITREVNEWYQTIN